MSCNEWERGTIRLPLVEYRKVRGATISVRNIRQENILRAAKTFYAAFQADVRAKKVDRQKAYTDLVDATFRDSDDGWRFDVLRLVPFNHTKGTIRLPVKSDEKRMYVRKSGTVHCGEASISFDNDTNAVSWDVPENNRARQAARKHPVALKFFNLLSNVSWTEGTGGVLVGNDEYNKDGDIVGDGGNYITAAYGPVGARERKLKRGGFDGR